jgi:hypothetical protein
MTLVPSDICLLQHRNPKGSESDCALVPVAGKKVTNRVAHLEPDVIRRVIERKEEGSITVCSARQLDPRGSRQYGLDATFLTDLSQQKVHERFLGARAEIVGHAFPKSVARDGWAASVEILFVDRQRLRALEIDHVAPEIALEGLRLMAEEASVERLLHRALLQVG